MRRNALIVPEQAVVLRPAGTVVYVVAGDAVTQRRVKTGVVSDGVIESAASYQVAVEELRELAMRKLGRGFDDLDLDGLHCLHKEVDAYVISKRAGAGGTT